MVCIPQRFTSLGGGASDLFKLVALLGAYDYEGSKSSFCSDNFVRAKVSCPMSCRLFPCRAERDKLFLQAMKEIQQLRQQITSICLQQLASPDFDLSTKLGFPSETQVRGSMTCARVNSLN